MTGQRDVRKVLVAGGKCVCRNELGQMIPELSGEFDVKRLSAIKDRLMDDAVVWHLNKKEWRILALDEVPADG